MTLNDSARWIDLQRRSLTAMALIVGLTLEMLLPPIVFQLTVLLCAGIMLHEWWRMTPHTAIWQLAGAAYILPAIASVLVLFGLEYTGAANGGRNMVLYLIVVIASVDVGAFFAGRRFGGPKLIPSISPNKTWAGLIGGILAAMLMSMLLVNFAPFPERLLTAAGLGIVLAVLAQTGDFIESWVKRRCGVKDSGAIFPGHGGLLDRLDGYMLSAPALLGFTLAFGRLL